MRKIHVPDRTGHTTLCETEVDIDVEFAKLVKSGYAMFLDDVKIKSMPPVGATAEVFALAPLVGG